MTKVKVDDLKNNSKGENLNLLCQHLALIIEYKVNAHYHH